MGLIALLLLSILMPRVMLNAFGPAGPMGQAASLIDDAGAIIWLLAGLIASVQTVFLTVAMRFNVVWVIFYGILALAPCLNILVLLSVSSQATAMLKVAGLRMGLLGVSDEQVMRKLASNRCRQCGYILTEGVATTVCPECGSPSPLSPR